MAEDQRSKSRCRSHSMPLSQIEASDRRGDDDEPSGSSNNLPSGSQPSGSQPSGSQPSGSQPSGSQPSGSQPSGSQPSGSRPSGSRPSGSRPSGSRPSGARPSVTDEEIDQLSRRMQRSLRINDEHSPSHNSDDSDDDELFAVHASPNVRRVLGVEVRRSSTAAWRPETAGRIQRLVRNFWPLSPIRRPTDPTEVPSDDTALKLPLVRFLLPLPNKRVRSMSENDNPLTVVQQQATREVGQTLRRLSDEFDGHMREKRQSEEFSHLYRALSSRPVRSLITLPSKRTLITGEPLIRSARPLRIASQRVFRRPRVSNPQDLLHEEEDNEVPEPIPHQDVPRPPVRSSPEPSDQGEHDESSEEEEQQR